MILELRDFLSGPLLEWGPRLTALFLLSVRPWRQHEPSGSLAYLLGKIYLALLMGALLLQQVASAPVFWFLLTGVHFFWVATAYSVADNHRYLEGYWCLAMAIALAVGGPEGAHYLVLDARLLIGLCFFFAALWKMLNQSYRNASFFVERLLFERRFLPIALWVGGLTPQVQMQHLEARSSVMTSQLNSAQAPVPERLRHTGLFLAWWTIAMETLVAALFLLPYPQLQPWRMFGLGLFVVTTYLLVPVPSFGQILLLMFLVTLENVQLRIYVLLLAVALALFAGLAHLLEKIARIRMKNLLRTSLTPLFGWTKRAASRRLERDGDSWRLLFPSVSLSLYVQSSWIDSLQRLLKIEVPFSKNKFSSIASGIPEIDLADLFNMLLTLKLLERTK